MEKIVQKTAEKYIKERGRKKRWQKVVTAMAAVVVFCTTYALIMPAVTQQGQAFCGVEEHKEHTADCYETKQVLTCTLSEEGHEHSSECFIAQPVLSCDILETDGHLHNESCYAEDGSLICEEIECEPHHHSDSCYTTEEICVCGLEEQPPHQHSEACYTTEETLVCELPIHEHSLQCFSNPEADLETSSVWERSFADITLSKNWSKDVLAIASTQIGYAESSKNYQVRDDGVTMDGYSRYGDWYGIPYGEWCAMFCSFCMHYAEVDPALMPMESGCQNWVEKLSAPALNLYHAANNERLLEQPIEEKYIPAMGDLIFFDWDTYDPEHPENREADHVGFVAELIFDEKTNELTKIKTIEGNWNDEVCCNYYSVDDERILGYGELPENPEENYVTIESAPAADGAVAVISGNLPEGAEAVIEAVNLTQNELEGYFGVEKAAQMTGVVAYDIKIVVDGEEWQPDESVSVVVKQKVLTAAESESFAVAHVDDDTSEVADLNGKLSEDGEITFDTDGFSLYIFYTFTVDFHYDDVTFSINGMDSVLLSDLFYALGIERSVNEVVSVSISNDDLIQITALADGDWSLLSLQAFSSEEELTVLFNDGTGLIIRVTDAQVDSNSLWELVTSTAQLSADDTYIIVGTRSGSYYLMGANGSTATASSVSLTRQGDGSYKLNNAPAQAQQWGVTANGSSLTVRNANSNYYLRLNRDTLLSRASNTVTGNYTMDSGNTYGGYWRFNNGDFYMYCGTSEFGRSTLNSSYRPLQILRLLTADVVWCYHNGASTPYAKYATLHDATVENANLLDGDVIELHGNTRESKQVVIQKSVTVKSEANKNYIVDFGTSSNDFTYIDIPCDKHADPNVTIDPGEIETRDCITVVPATFGTKLKVLFEDITLDGLTAYQSSTLNDHHLLQLIHGAEVTLSGATLQNFNIAEDCPSNGAISLDGRTTVADGGCHLILKDGTVMKNCNSYKGSPYNTGGIAINSSTLDMYDATIEGCSSKGGPAIMVDAASACTLHSGALIQNCHAIEEGGAIRNSGTFTMESGSTIKDCSPQPGAAETAIGGAIWNRSGGTVDISGGLIENCSANRGGAVYNLGTVYVSGGTITGNTAAADSKSYSGATATLGSGIYQGGTMYLSGAPSFGSNQDVYLPTDKVITKNGDITAASSIPVVLENEPRFRDILVSQTEDGCIVGENDMIAFDIKLSESASVTVDGALKYLGVVYSETGLDSAESPANVLELDVSEILIVNKVWNDNETTHPPVTVYLYKDGESEPVAEREISEQTDWKATFTGLEVSADGTLPYYVKEAEIEGYISSISTIDLAPGGRQAYWVPVRPNALSSGEFVIYGNSVALSHSGSTLKTASPALTNKSIEINGQSYSRYFTEDQITDNEIWTATGSSSTLTTKDGYRLDYNSSSIRLNTSSGDTWSITSGKLRQGTGSSSYLVLPSLTASDSSSGTAVQAYQKVLGDDIPAHYEVTITNRTITYTSLIVNKQWSDGNANHENDTVDVTLVSSYGEDPVTKTLSAANEWSAKFENLIAPAEDEEFGYTVLEEDFSGYVSIVGDTVLVPGSEGQAWVPANNNAFVSGHSYLLYSGTAAPNSTGRLVRRTTNNGITGESVTLGGALTIGDKSYTTHIPVSQIPADTAYHAWTATASGNGYFKLTNGGYYIRNQSTPIGSSTNNSDRLNMNNNHIRFYRSVSDNPYYYLRAIGATVDRTSSASSASQFTLYELVDAGEPTPDSYSVTIQNKKVLEPEEGEIQYSPDMYKRIDYLGDGIDNPDTDASGEDLYRLYLDLNSQLGPMDLLIIADCSNSMGYSFEGQTTGVAETEKRAYALDATLNGTIIRAGSNTTAVPDGYYRNATRQADGLIYQFLHTNPDNRVALIGYGNSTQVRTTWKTAADFGTAPESFYVNVQHSDPDQGSIASYTNYHLGLKNAKEQLLDLVKNDGRQKAVIFLTDGEANRYVLSDGSTYPTGTDKAEVSEACEYAAAYLRDNYLVEYPKLMFYVVGISKDATDPETVQATALKNISEVYGQKDAYLTANTAHELSQSLMEIIYSLGMRPITIMDTLAEYMDFANPLDLLITMSDADGGNKVTLWDPRGETSANTVNGQKLILSADNTGKTGEVKFNPAMKMDGIKKFTVSYNVQLTGTPVTEPTVGDLGTDYDTEHKTSSGMEGYNANARAVADYTQGQNVYRSEYAHPVVQLAEYSVHLRKVDAESTDVALSGAEFDLYVECGSNEAGSSLVPGMENTYWRKVNTAPIVSSATEDIVVENLRAGRYYLVETKAPDGHLLLQNPLSFTLSSDGITTTDAMAEVDDNDAFIIYVKNTAGYVLPETGGIGTPIYTLCGIAMMAAALMYGLSLKRKRERRYMK